MRELTGRQKEALINENDSYVGLFLSFTHPDGEANIWSGLGTVIVIRDGLIIPFLGVGEALSFSGLISTERNRINDLAFTLSNVPEELAIIEANKDVRGHSGSLSVGIVDANHWVIDGLIPIQEFDLDKIDMQTNKETSVLILSCFSGIADITTPTGLYWTKGAQDEWLRERGFRPSADTGFDEMNRIRESINLVWRLGEWQGVDTTTTAPHPVSIAGTKPPIAESVRREFYVPDNT